MAGEIATALLPVFFVLALGYGAGKRGLVDNTNVDTLNTLVMSIALPIALFTSLAAGRRDAVLARWPLAVSFFLAMAVVYAGTYVVQRRIHGLKPGEAALQALTVAFPNLAAVGLPLVGSVLGPDAVLSVAAALGIGSITLTPYTIVVLERERGGAVGRVIRKSLRNPVVLGPLLGLAWSLSGLPLPDVLRATLTAIGSVTGGVALFLTGLVLSAQAVEFSRNAYVSTVVAAVVRPGLGYLAVLAFGLTGPLAQETVLLLAVPPGFFGVLLGIGYHVRPAVAGTTLLFATLASAVTLSAVIALLPRF
ncbi:AEC family transporter [Actinoplanes sp. Pm04-4]|uniref:AEC family transporter n=1 Tax=Paractinoplanes pyxinae TaxID=2997416 RepID=A0ABT4AY06_9ACTN|nr:AEC family transporter [Actinoplanes pyxinae]MCY1139127.1 AEC family transporter [Actinoplanes pyxinae]